MNQNNFNENATNEVSKENTPKNKKTTILLSILLLVLVVFVLRVISTNKSEESVPVISQGTINNGELEEENEDIPEVTDIPEPVIEDEEDVITDPNEEVNTPENENPETSTGEETKVDESTYVQATSELPEFDAGTSNGLPSPNLEMYKSAMTYSLWSTNYLDGLNFQIRDVDLSNKTIQVMIANTGSSDFLVSNDTVFVGFFIYDVNKAGTNLVGGNYNLKPGESKLFTITYTNNSAKALYFVYKGEETWVDFDNTNYIEKITDTKPLNSDNGLVNYDMEYEGKIVPYLGSFKTFVMGNGKYKIVTTHMQLTSNEKLGVIERPDNGLILLVNLQLANTSTTSMEIEEVWVYTSDPNTFKDENKYIITGEEYSKLLGNNGLPIIIEPNTIVEGYLPALYTNSNEASSIVIKTNLGFIHVTRIDDLVPIEWLN